MNMLQWMHKARRVRHQRIELRELSDDMLRDIGVDRKQALREANRWPWDLGSK